MAERKTNEPARHQLHMIRLSLLVLAVFANAALAECNLFMADVPALTDCAKTQGYIISGQARDIELLRKQIDRLIEIQSRHQESISKLSDQVFELRSEVYLLGLKIPKSTK